MSVIGPRPGLWNQDILTAERDKYNANDVKPGLTGWAQINGRDELEIPVKAKLDGEYVSKMGLMMDIKCFLGSVGVFAHDDSVVEGGTGELHNEKYPKKAKVHEDLDFTEEKRLARNLLRDVVGRYVGNEPESLFALEEIQKTAALMRFELERGNIDGFASLLDYHWELSKKVDAGSSNTLIEQIFSSIEELIDGKLVCGAGGGGFLQVILKKGVTRQQVEERLNEVFMDSLVGVADCRLVWE